MTCHLILSALSYYLLACGNYTSNCNTLYNTTQQSLILCNQKDVKQVFQETEQSRNESYKNITHTGLYTMVTTTVKSMDGTTTDSPREETSYLQHNQSEHPSLRGSTTIVNLTNITGLNESLRMNQSYHVNMSNWTNASGTNIIRRENLSSTEREDHSAHHGLSIALAATGVVMVVIGALKCNRMHKQKKKKRKSIKSVSPERPKNRNSWATSDDIKLHPIIKPFEKKKMVIKEITPSAPPPPVPPRAMKVKDLHKPNSLNMIKHLRHHKQAKENGVNHLRSQMQKLRVINNMNKINN